MRRQSGLYCKVYFSLLAISYLEVVLWTTALLASCASVASGDSQGYLLRETGNFKCVVGLGKQQAILRVPAWIKTPECIRLDHAALRAQTETAACPQADVLQPAFSILRFSEELQGTPAPYTGINTLI